MNWWQPKQQVNHLMLHVLLALLPGALLLLWTFGPGLLVNLSAAVAGALLAEYLCLRLRGRAPTALRDLSAVVTGVLLALALPPATSPGITLLAAGIAVALGKQVFGGLGQNPFNPAMVGYAAVLVSFPAALAVWPEAKPLPELFLFEPAARTAADGGTGATPLDAFRFRGEASAAEFRENYPLINPWIHLNLLFLAGGLYLLLQGCIRWQASAGMLLGLGLCALAFGEGVRLDGLLFHLFHGATMLGAFFIVTDPVSSPRHREAQWLFGGGVGVLVFWIRTAGGYPDGLAFAVLIMNGLAPLLDRLPWPERTQNGEAEK